MQSQVLLRWLTRRACAPGVLSSRQIGMTVHALHQLDVLVVLPSPAPFTNILPVVKDLCLNADGRSQANMLHALACATTEQCSPRVTVHAELRHVLQLLQDQLVETASSLTAPETILVMEALLKLTPFAGDAGSLVCRRLLDEVQERSMALASVVERPVDLLGVTRVAVEAATSAAMVGTPSSSSFSCLPSLASVDGATSWAKVMLEHVLSVVQARLGTFADQDLISLVDILTVRGSDPTDEEPSPSNSIPSGALSSSSSNVHEVQHVRESGTKREAGNHAGFLDAARFLLDDVLGRAATTVPKLSVGQLSAWLTRLIHLHLTEHPLLCMVVRALTAAAREKRDFSAAQLSSVLKALGAYLPVIMPLAVAKWADKELYVIAYTQMLSQLTSQLHQRSRNDAAAFAEVQTCLLPLLGSVPEAALDAYLQLASAEDARMSVPRGTATPANSSSQVRVFVVLSASLERTAAVLLRYFHQLVPREQAHVAAFVFHWRLYMPGSADELEPDDSSLVDASDTAVSTVARTPKAVEMVGLCNLLSTDVVFRKHHAVCGLVESSLTIFSVKDVVEVLNEVVVAHHTQQKEQQRRQKQREQLQQRNLRATSGAEETLAMTSAVERDHTSGSTIAMLEASAKERNELAAHLFAQLQGPLQGKLTDLHTAQLVRYLVSMSKMATRARAPYNAALLVLKGRTLTSFEQISVLGVLARHHLRSPYILYGVVRDLPQLGQTLHSKQKALLLKYLGQAGAQRLVKAPCAEDLKPGAFFQSKEELSTLSMLELVFSFNGLVELRQNANATTTDVLDEMARRVSVDTHGYVETFYSTKSPHVLTFHAVRSPTTLAELVASLCRYGGPSKGVTASLLEQAMRALRLRLATSRSLFVDVTQLTLHWPYVEQYFQPASAVWGGMAPVALDTCSYRGDEGQSRGTFSTEEWARVTKAFQELCATVQQQLRARLTDIATSPQLRCNTFLWNQLACGVRFDALPLRGSRELERLWENLDRKNLAPLLGDPQHLLDVMTLALYRVSESEVDAEMMLGLVKKHIASLRVQDGLQVWWYAEQYLSSAFQTNVPAPSQQKAWQLIQAVREAAKQHVLRKEKVDGGRLSLMEQRLFQSLL